jgi:hypothetical protein
MVIVVMLMAIESMMIRISRIVNTKLCKYL